MIKNYIFDFDGTLADSSIGIYKAFSSTCIKNNLKPPEINVFKKHIGPPIYKLIYSIYPNITDSQKNTFVKTFRSEYDNNFYKYVDWYEGVFEVINYLTEDKKLNLFIITNKPTLTCIKLLKHANLLNFFKIVIGIDYKIFNNENPSLNFEDKSKAFDYFFSKTKLLKDQSIYIGDTISDKKAADKCNLNFIAAKYGFYKWNLDPKNYLQINSFMELKEISQLS